MWEWDCAERGRAPTAAEFAEACLRPNLPGIIRNAYATGIGAVAEGHNCGTLSSLCEVLAWIVRQSQKDERIAQRKVPVVSQHATVGRGRCGSGGGNDDQGGCRDVELREAIAAVGGGERLLAALDRNRSMASDDVGAKEASLQMTSDGCSPGMAAGGTAMYWKDWHVVSELVGGAQSTDDDHDGLLKLGALRGVGEVSHAAVARALYGGPPPFLGGEDWLNELCDDRLLSSAPAGDEEGDDGGGGHHDNNAPPSSTLGGGAGADYRFCYIGGRGTWTPLHVDVYGSYSWSLNVAGRKSWYFARPEDFDSHWQQFFALPGTYTAQLPPDIRCSTIPFEAVVQHPGDVVFVPSMYLHQVHNDIDDVAVSVNHNWARRDNAQLMVRAMAGECAAIDAMVDEEAREMFVASGEWIALRERMLQGSGAWCITALRGYLLAAAARRRHRGEGNEVDDDPTTIAALIATLDGM